MAAAQWQADLVTGAAAVAVVETTVVDAAARAQDGEKTKGYFEVHPPRPRPPVVRAVRAYFHQVRAPADPSPRAAPHRTRATPSALFGSLAGLPRCPPRATSMPSVLPHGWQAPCTLTRLPRLMTSPPTRSGTWCARAQKIKRNAPHKTRFLPCPPPPLCIPLMPGLAPPSKRVARKCADVVTLTTRAWPL